MPPVPGTGIDAEDRALRARLATWFAGVLASVLAVATVVRPFVADVGWIFTLFGVVHTLFVGGLWLLFRSGRVDDHAPVILMTAACVLLVPVALVSGGPNSQFAVLVPLFPVCAVMLGGRRMAWAVMGWWMVALPLMLAAAGQVPDLTGDADHPAKAPARTLWLILAAAVGLAFALHFERSMRELRERLLENAERDPLTGVANRRGLDRALGGILAHATRRDTSVTLMVVDVDHFKRYNDFHGHADGDLALKAVAEALSTGLRAGQDLVARFGGEEFVVVLADTDHTAARFVAEKLRNAIRARNLHHDDREPAVLTATIGWISVPAREVASHDELLRRADAALYEGKRRGRDRAVDADELPAAEPPRVARMD
jgi:diguanylate cyclase (GGDEF)-like protein